MFDHDVLHDRMADTNFADGTRNIRALRPHCAIACLPSPRHEVDRPDSRHGAGLEKNDGTYRLNILKQQSKMQPPSEALLTSAVVHLSLQLIYFCGVSVAGDPVFPPPIVSGFPGVSRRSPASCVEAALSTCRSPYLPCRPSSFRPFKPICLISRVGRRKTR